jgi:predicted AAA+ superfamily ATPase
MSPDLTESFFLFGARGTGKSTLLKKLISEKKSLYVDLLDSEVEEKYALSPSLLYEELKLLQKNKSEIKWIIIDEVQKNPALLNTVHRLIEEKYFKFALTGSSARKLKRGHANLLAGRAFVFNLFPLTHQELKADFDLIEYLTWGGLPKIFELSTLNKKRFLKSYTQTYLKEEILEEQLIRNLTPFRHFLEVAAQSGSKIINYSRIAADVGVESPTVQSYFEILEDTYLGFLLPPFHESLRKRQRKNPKFYFFDLGIQRALAKKLDLPLQRQSYEFGDLFESFIVQEIHRLIHYQEKEWTLSYLRTKDDLEVDLIIDRHALPRAYIEIKSTEKIQNEDFQGFKNLLKLDKNSEGYVLSNDKKEFIRDGLIYLPWKKGLAELGLD